jgi:hypothetical protein
VPLCPLHAPVAERLTNVVRRIEPTAQKLTILWIGHDLLQVMDGLIDIEVEKVRDIGQVAKYVFDTGGQQLPFVAKVNAR